jgi:hypothetical protein
VARHSCCVLVTYLFDRVLCEEVCCKVTFWGGGVGDAGSHRNRLCKKSVVPKRLI